MRNSVSKTDEDTPPSSRSRWGIAIAAVLLTAFFLLHFSRKEKQRAGRQNQSTAISNLRMIGLALGDFQSEYGQFPDESTVAAVKHATSTPLSLTGNTSNDLFAQLLATNVVETEIVFHAGSEGMLEKADNVFHEDSTILIHGECAFAYITGGSFAADPERPVVFGPIIPGTNKIDAKFCNGRAVVLMSDNSAGSVKISSSGKIFHQGKDLLDPSNPIWNGRPPDIRWPK